jgi:4-hydroxythreonine-4-phosphate dehydrogenase
MGDPSGIGPELVLKVLSEADVYQKCRPIVIGDPRVLLVTAEAAGIAAEIRSVGDLSEAEFRFGQIDVLKPDGVDVTEVEWGKLSAEMGKAAGLCLAEAYVLAQRGEVDGVVSAPLNKEAFHMAGYEYRDELDYLREFTNSQDALLLGLAGRFWTVAVAEHVSFRSIPDLVKTERILSYARRMNATLKAVGIEAPRIAVAALNVHGGEGGLFGREEIDEIEPAIRQALAEGIAVNGPIPADAVFVSAVKGDYDGVVCMYHDQANIARKLHAPRRGATIFVGLPAPCGTTAHGTAFDIAGRGVAEPGSLSDALTYTILLASRNKRA